MNTLLPVPVEPAISRCGICVNSAARMRPIKSLPRGSVSLEDECENSGDSMMSRSAIVSRRALGTSIPTVDLPGMRSIRIDSARSARQRSSARPGNPAVFDSGLGLELESGHHRAGIDLRHVAADFEFRALLFDGPRALLQFASPIFSLRSEGCSRIVGGKRKFVLLREIFGSGALFFGGGGARIVEIYYVPDRVRPRAFGRWLFVFFLVLFDFLGRDSLLNDGTASRNLGFFHLLSQADRFALFAPFLRAGQQLARAAFSGHRLLHPCEQRAERKSGGQEKSGEQSRNGHQIRANRIESRAQSLREKLAEHTARRHATAHVRHANQTQLRGKRAKHQPPADQLRDGRIHRLAAEPPHRQNEHAHRKQKRRVTGELEERIRDIRPDKPNPVVRRTEPGAPPTR